MPNPDGTFTRDEHRRALIRRSMKHVLDGVDPDEALTRAAAEHKEEIQRAWAQKTADCLKALGVKPQ